MNEEILVLKSIYDKKVIDEVNLMENDVSQIIGSIKLIKLEVGKENEIIFTIWNRLDELNNIRI